MFSLKFYCLLLVVDFRLPLLPSCNCRCRWLFMVCLSVLPPILFVWKAFSVFLIEKAIIFLKLKTQNSITKRLRNNLCFPRPNNSIRTDREWFIRNDWLLSNFEPPPRSMLILFATLDYLHTTRTRTRTRTCIIQYTVQQIGHQPGVESLNQISYKLQ